MFDFEDSKNIKLKRNLTTGDQIAKARRVDMFEADENVALGQHADDRGEPKRRWARRAFDWIQKEIVLKALSQVVLWILATVAATSGIVTYFKGVWKPW